MTKKYAAKTKKIMAHATNLEGMTPFCRNFNRLSQQLRQK